MKIWVFRIKGSFKGAIGIVMQLMHQLIHIDWILWKVHKILHQNTTLVTLKEFLKIAQKSTCIFEKVL